jgi:hypothetical protein
MKGVTPYNNPAFLLYRIDTIVRTVYAMANVRPKFSVELAPVGSDEVEIVIGESLFDGLGDCGVRI